MVYRRIGKVRGYENKLDRRRLEKMEKMRKKIEELRKIYPYISSPPQRYRQKMRNVYAPSQARLLL